MATTLINKMNIEAMAKASIWVVIHPLDDRPEEKIDTASLGAMPMTASVKYSLLSLRAYLILMVGLVLYRFIAMAGFFGLHAREEVKYGGLIRQ